MIYLFFLYQVKRKRNEKEETSAKGEAKKAPAAAVEVPLPVKAKGTATVKKGKGSNFTPEAEHGGLKMPDTTLGGLLWEYEDTDPNINDINPCKEITIFFKISSA